MIKMRAPAGLTGFSHRGHALEPDEDGAVHVDSRHRHELEAHGFSPGMRRPGHSCGLLCLSDRSTRIGPAGGAVHRDGRGDGR